MLSPPAAVRKMRTGAWEECNLPRAPLQGGEPGLQLISIFLVSTVPRGLPHLLDSFVTLSLPSTLLSGLVQGPALQNFCHPPAAATGC